MIIWDVIVTEGLPVILRIAVKPCMGCIHLLCNILTREGHLSGVSLSAINRTLARHPPPHAPPKRIREGGGGGGAGTGVGMRGKGVGLLRIAVSILQVLKDSLLEMSLEDMAKFFKMMKSYETEELDEELKSFRIGQLLMQHTVHVQIPEYIMEYLRSDLDSEDLERADINLEYWDDGTTSAAAAGSSRSRACSGRRGPTGRSPARRHTRGLRHCRSRVARPPRAARWRPPARPPP
ncbi:unnamed protein product, partial [Prorocentrum cordatum]